MLRLPVRSQSFKQLKMSLAMFAGALLCGLAPGFAQTDAMSVDSNGNVGIGTNTPEQVLHVSRTIDNGFLAGAMLQNADGSPASNLTGVGFRVQAGSTLAYAIDFNAVAVGANSEFRINMNDGDGRELALSAAGNLTVTGSVFSGGPTCAAGCDAVFSEDYPLPSISEHADEMWGLGHLPAVGPTEPGVPMNMTEKLGGILNELEKAHIYIQELHSSLGQQRAELDALRQELVALKGQD
jgi:hypothetical protein